MNPLWEHFFSSGSVEILEPNLISAKILKKVLVDQGVAPEKIFVNSTPEKTISSDRIVLSAESDPLRSVSGSHIRGVVSSDGSPITVSRAAEGALDFYLMRPFDPPRFVAVLTQALERKLQPSPYLRVIRDIWEGARVAEDESAIQESLGLFQSACSLDPKPALALSYCALMHEKLDQFSEAASCCQEALSHHPAHFSSHNTLSRVLLRMRKTEEAYNAFQNFVSIYPTSGVRLDSALRFAIIRKSFEDVDALFAMLEGEKTLGAEADRALSAGLVTCGKHFFGAGNQSRAREYFKKAMKFRGFHPSHRTEIEAFLKSHRAEGFFASLTEEPRKKSGVA